MFNKHRIVSKVNFLYLSNISTKKFDKFDYKNNLPKLTQFSARNMEIKNKESFEFANKLISQGHKCIEYLETYPVRIRWCEKNKCIHE